MTADREKLEMFADDGYLDRGLAYAQQALTAPIGQLLQCHALLVIQPDCLAKRMADTCIEYVKHHEFEPIWSVRFRIEPEMTDALWNYQSDASTQDSCDIADLLCAKTDSLLVLLRDTAVKHAVPASVRLTTLKGPSNPAKRTTSQLRTVIGAPNKLVVLVHTSDEPIDLIREAAIMRGPLAPELFAAMASPVVSDAASRLTASIEALYRDCEPHDMDPEAALRRLVARLTAMTREERRATVASRLMATLERVGSGVEKLDWQEFERDLTTAGLDPSGWDPILVGSQYIEHDRPGVPRLVGVGAQQWLRGGGALLSRDGEGVG